MKPIRVLLVDDHELVRRGVAAVLGEEEDIQVVAQASDGAEAIQWVDQVHPDVVLMDLRMPGTSGLQATAILNQRIPKANVLILTVSEEARDLQEALRFGALGYILKGAPPEALVHAVRQVSQGWVVISPRMAGKMMVDFPQERHPLAPAREDSLSAREREVLHLLAQGLANKEIADTLVVSENTVKTHMRSILTKLHLKNRTQAAAYARLTGSSS
ncbi:MAG: two component transcriptional regulator, LuxR family [Dehalococcoidia bacterium]|nr:two component transcriptional regulator, LuxR family [Dehalococcoidia bacterium]